MENVGERVKDLEGRLMFQFISISNSGNEDQREPKGVCS